MSHFCVIVIGEDVEAQLQPYHEFECTGVDDQYVVDVDQTAEVQAKIAEYGLRDGLEYFGLHDRQVADEADADRDGAHQYGYAVVRDGVLVKAVDRTNPNAKWDWWVIGGRWSGYFTLRNGDKADAAAFCEIDFRKMRDDAAVKAAARFDKYRAIIGGAPTPETFDAIRVRHTADGQTDWDAASAEYGAQPAVRAIRAYRDDHDFVMMTCDEVQALHGSQDLYVDAARRRAVAPYAVLKDGVWHAKGEMGWFGLSRDAEAQDDWNRRADALLEGLAPDTRLTIVDCHI